MSVHRAAYDGGASQAPRSARATYSAGPVVLFIAAVLIAGMTCILYLWQQSQIVAGQQDIVVLNSQLTLLTQQRDDLLAQEQNLRSVTNVVAHAVQYGMVQSSSATSKYLALTPATAPSNLVAQRTGPAQQPVILPATNAAITSWWQDAWAGLYNLLQ